MLIALGCLGVAALGLSLFAELDLASATMVAFAASFSSTVFAFKTLEDRGELNALYGRRVHPADATDPDFWNRLQPDPVELAVLTMTCQSERLFAAQQLVACNFPGRVAAVTRYPDEGEELREAGVSAVYSFYEEAGSGLAARIRERIEALRSDTRDSSSA